MIESGDINRYIFTYILLVFQRVMVTEKGLMPLALFIKILLLALVGYTVISLTFFKQRPSCRIIRPYGLTPSGSAQALFKNALPFLSCKSNNLRYILEQFIKKIVPSSVPAELRANCGMLPASW
ncbi:hypothetical protein JFY74_04375 [Pectobacterium carotovorum]|nr:hypothetical protein JFY74_04375 [Pectobacterium carotovorum]